MKTSTKRLLMMCIGIIMFVGYVIYEDTNVLEMELHQYFMLGVIVFFTVLNFIRYVIELNNEFNRKWGETHEGR